MPTQKQKPSDIATEAKRRYIPYCAAEYSHFKPNSILVTQARILRPVSTSSSSSTTSRLRVAVIDGDAVDVAFDWWDYESSTRVDTTPPGPIAVVNMANERRPGGDWELGLIAPEENLCRRSNLVQCLTTPWPGTVGQHYPIPQYGGIYSPSVVVFRSGPDKNYSVWPDFRSLSVISVAPSRRPKLDESGERCSFADEAEHVRNKIRTILRIAAEHHHLDLVVGPWGLGAVYKNPARQLAQMWQEILFREEEFKDRFSNVVFAIDTQLPGSTAGAGDGNKAESSGLTYFEIFKQELDPSNIHRDGYRLRAH